MEAQEAAAAAIKLQQAQKLAKAPAAVFAPRVRMTDEMRQMFQEASEVIKREGMEDQPYTYTKMKPDGTTVSITLTVVTKYSPYEWAVVRSRELKTLSEP